MFMIQLSGTHEGGSTCHLTRRLMVVRKRGGMGSTTSSRKIPGGFPYLSCESKQLSINILSDYNMVDTAFSVLCHRIPGTTAAIT